MSLLTDIRSVSDSVIEQLSGRFHDLPRPLLAAIGAGDMAVERLAALREQLTGTAGGAPTGDDVKAFAADLPARAQQVAGEVAHHLEQFASDAPQRAAHLIGELPAKASEITDSLSPDNIRGTVEAYTQFVAMIYDNLAERGGKTVTQERSGRDGGGSTQRSRTTATAPAGRSARTPAAGTGKRGGRKGAATVSRESTAGSARTGKAAGTASATPAARAATKTAKTKAATKAASKRAPKRATAVTTTAPATEG